MVKAYKRKQNILDVLNKADLLVLETFRLTRSEDIFPKKCQRIMAEPLINNCRQLSYEITIANELDADQLYELQMRLEHQYKAKELISMIACDFKMATDYLKVDPAKFNQSFELIGQLRYLIKGWIMHSKDKLKGLQTKEENEKMFRQTEHRHKSPPNALMASGSLRIPELVQSSLGK